MMRFFFIVLLLSFSSASAFSQVNYVLNPDFEKYSFCPWGFDQIKAANHWSGLDTSQSSNPPAIPEYCNSCASGTSILVGVPSSGYYFQYGQSGDGFAQIISFFDESVSSQYQRDYLQGRLVRRLTSGKSYCVSFYVSLTEASKHAIKEIGAYLDNGIIDTTKNYGLPQTKYTPQVSNTGGILNDTANWVKIEGTFVANGTEQFITIGNFKSKANTTYAPIPANSRNNGNSAWSWYLIDDVSVIESDLKADAGPDRHIGLGDSTYLGRAKEVGLECSWSVLGSSTVIGNGAGIWVKPATTTSYVVTQTLCGQVKRDTVWVGVWGVGVSSTAGKSGQGYTLSPNPNAGAFELRQSIPADESLPAEAIDMLGRKVYAGELHFREGVAAVQTEGLAPGLYVLKFGGPFVRPLRFEIR